MALRIRESGEIVCAAMHPEQPGDTYINDGHHYRLSVELGVIVTDRFHLRKDPDVYRRDPEDYGSQLDGHGLWWWINEVPESIEIEGTDAALGVTGDGS